MRYRISVQVLRVVIKAEHDLGIIQAGSPTYPAYGHLFSASREFFPYVSCHYHCSDAIFSKDTLVCLMRKKYEGAWY